MPEYDAIDDGVPPKWQVYPTAPAVLTPPPQTTQNPVITPAVPLDPAAVPVPVLAPSSVDHAIDWPPPLETYAGYPPPPPPPPQSPGVTPVVAPLEPLPSAGPAYHALPTATPDLTSDQDAWQLQHAPQSFHPALPPPPLDITAVDPFAGLTDAQGFSAAGKLTPEALLQLETIRNSRKAIAAETRQHQIDDENLRQIKQNAEAQRIANEKTRSEEDHINADAAVLGKQKLDRGRWFRDASVVQKIGAIVGTLAGGLMSKPGQPNQGVQFLANIIDNDIADQKYDLENKRSDLQFRSGAVAREYQRTGDLYRSTEAVRLATYNALLGQLQTDQQNFDPRGTMFGEYGKQIAAWRAHVATSQEAQRRVRFDEHQKIAKLGLEAQELVDKRLQHQQTTALGYAQLDSAKADRKAAADARADDKAIERADRASAAHEKDVKERSLGGEVRPVLDAAGNVVGREVGPITKANGDVWIPSGTEATITAFQKKHDATLKLIGTLDEIRRIGPEWLSGTANSDKYQRLTQLMGQARLQAIAANDLGVPTGHDIELAENFLGSSDVTRRKDSIAGIMQSRDSLVRDHKIELRSRGLDKDWNPPDLGAVPAAADTDTDRLRQELFEKPTQSFDDVAHDAIASRQRGLTPDERRNPEIYNATVSGGIEDARQIYDPDASPKQQREIARLGTIAGGTGSDSENARKTLREVAAGAHTARLRELAQKALLDSVTSSVLQGGAPEQVR